MDVSFTLSHIRSPMLNIGCGALINMGVAYQGHLRRKRAIHNIADKLRISSLATGLFSWETCYVVLHNGCLYVYKDEKQTKPDKAFSLFGYTQVLRAGEWRQKDVGWPFKIIYILDTDAKVHYFSTDSEADMKKWMMCVKSEMILANNISYTDDSLSNDDYSDLETPVSTRNYFRSIQNLGEIQNTLGDDSDLEEYTYPHEPCLLNHVNNDQYSSPETAQRHTPPILPTRAAVSRQPPTPVRPAAAADSDGPVSSRRPLPPTPQLTSATINRDVTGTPATDESMSHSSVAEHHHQSHQSQQPKQQRQRPPVTPKPAVACRKQRRWSPAVNRDDDADTAAVEPSDRRVTPSSADHLPSSHSSATQQCQTSESSVRLSHASPAGLSVSSAGTRSDRPVPPTRHRRHRQRHNIDADSQTNGHLVTDLETAATWSGDPGEGNRLMMQLEAEGTYMIRPSVDSSSKTLLAVAEFQLRKYRVHVNKDQKYSLEVHYTHMFDSIHQLLSFYKENNLPNRRTKLAKPYSELMGSLPS